jgi:hypothetical protein
MTNAIGLTTRKKSSAKMTGFTTFAIAVPTFNQSLLSVDKREGAIIPSNNSKAPEAKIKHTTEEIAPAANAFVAPMTINMLPTVQPNARSLPASVGSSAL